MLRRFFKGIATLALAAAILPASASEPTKYNYRGESVQGLFNLTDGCVQTDVFLYASDQSTYGKSSIPESSSASVYVSRYDMCSGTTLLNAIGYGVLEEEDFDTDQRLSSAKLQTTVYGYDWNTGESITLDVDVAWDGNGDLTRTNYHYHYDMGDTIVNGHHSGTSRVATMSGSVSDGTTNFIEGATGAGTIMDAKSGTIIVE